MMRGQKIIQVGGDELVLPSICQDSAKRQHECNHMHDYGSVAATQENVHSRTGAAWKPPVYGMGRGAAWTY